MVESRSERNIRKEGYRAGYLDGYRLGCCETVVRKTAPTKQAYRDLRILFIPQGFESIDTGIIHGFQGMVRELLVAPPEEMLQTAQSSQPDLVLVLNGLHVFPANHLDQIDAIRALGIKTAIWFADDPYFVDLTLQIIPHYDYVFTHELSCVPLYRANGCPQSHYLPLAVPTSIYKPQASGGEYRSDVCFIGNAFPNRIEFFNVVLPRLSKRKVVFVGALWDQLVHYKQFAEHIHLGWMPLEETVNYYNGAKIVVNLHRPAVDSKYSRNALQIPGRSINPRTFEIAACGAFQLSDVRDDLPVFYAPGKEIEIYGSPREFLRKVDHYLKHESERTKVALRGLRRTLRDHRYSYRLNELLNVVFGR